MIIGAKIMPLLLPESFEGIFSGEGKEDSRISDLRP